MSQLITISPSPHAQTPVTVKRLMTNVIVALLPAVALALYCFGIGAAIVIVTAIAGCVVTEYLISRYMLGEKPTTGNMSAVLTVCSLRSTSRRTFRYGQCSSAALSQSASAR